MLDTVKLTLVIPNPLIFKDIYFDPITPKQLLSGGSYAKTHINPPKYYAQNGRYMPRLTLYKRTTNSGISKYELAIEFSAPKLLFGNNFDEIQEEDFDATLAKLQIALKDLVGFHFFKAQLAKANVSILHLSKNIVFLDHSSCQTIINTIAKLDVSRTYDLRKTNFRDGQVVHIHANSINIAFYDKLADLRKSQTSEKRALEKDNCAQLSLLNNLTKKPPIEVLRYEVRLCNRAMIKRTFPDIKDWTFENLFKKDLSKSILIANWKKITAIVNLLSLDSNRPYELFHNYLLENPDASSRTALAAVGAMLIISQEGFSSFRNLLESNYGKHTWYRLKPNLTPPKSYRFRSFTRVDDALEQFTPIKLSCFIDNLNLNLNNVN